MPAAKPDTGATAVAVGSCSRLLLPPPLSLYLLTPATPLFSEKEKPLPEQENQTHSAGKCHPLPRDKRNCLLDSLVGRMTYSLTIWVQCREHKDISFPLSYSASCPPHSTLRPTCPDPCMWVLTRMYENLVSFGVDNQPIQYGNGLVFCSM